MGVVLEPVKGEGLDLVVVVDEGLEDITLIKTDTSTIPKEPINETQILGIKESILGCIRPPKSQLGSNIFLKTSVCAE